MALAKPTETASVFERYRRDVYGWAYRLLGRHHDALDAAQDVFLRWIDQSRRSTPDNPRGWLRQVTINRAIDQLRSRRSADAGCPTLWGTELEPAASAVARIELKDPIETEELRRDIVEALRELTDSQRSVLVAKVFDGLTFAQIAEEQELAIPTVKTHYLRALSAVRGPAGPALGTRKETDMNRDEMNDLLADYLGGELDPEQRKRFEESLPAEPEFAAEVASLRQTLAAMRSLDEPATASRRVYLGAPSNALTADSSLPLDRPALWHRRASLLRYAAVILLAFGAGYAVKSIAARGESSPALTAPKPDRQPSSSDFEQRFAEAYGRSSADSELARSLIALSRATR